MILKCLVDIIYVILQDIIIIVSKFEEINLCIMFLQKLLTNYQTTKILPLGKIVSKDNIDYYGPFLFDKNAKSYDLVAPLYNKPFGAFFPPSFNQPSEDTTPHLLLEEINLILSQYFKFPVYLKRFAPTSQLPLMEKEYSSHIQQQKLNDVIAIQTPFGDDLELSCTQFENIALDVNQLYRIKNELRFICDESYQHILKSYDNFVNRFLQEVVCKTDLIQFKNNLFSTQQEYYLPLIQLGIITEKNLDKIVWRFPFCLNQEDENCLIKLFNSIYTK